MTRTFRAAARIYWSSSSRTKNKAPYLRKGSSAATKLCWVLHFLLSFEPKNHSMDSTVQPWHIPVKLPWLHRTPRGVLLILPLERRNSDLQSESQPGKPLPRMALRTALPGSRPVGKKGSTGCADDIRCAKSSMFLLRYDFKI